MSRISKSGNIYKNVAKIQQICFRVIMSPISPAHIIPRGKYSSNFFKEIATVLSLDINTLHRGTPLIHCEHNVATGRQAEKMQKTAAARPYFRKFVNKNGPIFTVDFFLTKSNVEFLLNLNSAKDFCVSFLGDRRSLSL
jgi:hypothetical protein